MKLTISRRSVLKALTSAAWFAGLPSGVRRAFGLEWLSPPPPPAGPSLRSIAAYFTPDGFRHAIAATSWGKLHEVFFSPAQGKGVARLACFDSIAHIAGFFTGDDGYQHEIVATSDGNVHEIFFKPNDFHFSQPPLARFNGIVDVAAFHAEDDNNRIVIVATQDGNITEVFYHPSIGVHISQPPLARFSGIVSIAGFYSADDKFRHVIVATQDGNIREIFYHPSIGVHTSQPPLARFNGIVSIAAFYTPDDKFRHVIVGTQDGSVTEVFYHPSIGVHISQPPLAKVKGLTEVAGFYSPDDRFRHVITATQDGTVSEIFYHPSIGVHVSQPPLMQFVPPPATFEDFSADPSNVTAGTKAGLAQPSSAGRAIGLVGARSALYALVEKSGVWKSANGGPWAQLAGSPSQAALEGPQIAIDPANAQHLIVGNIDGAYESANGGVTWTLLLDPASLGCGSKKVSAVTIAQNGTIVLGLDCGVASRSPGAGSFTLTPTTETVGAFAVSQSKVWARTSRAVLVSSDNGTTWQSFPIPSSVSFDYRALFGLAAFDAFAYLAFSTPGVNQGMVCGTCGSDVKLLIFNAQTQQFTIQNVMYGGCNVCDGTGLGGRKFAKSFISRDLTLPRIVGQGLQLFVCAGQEIYQATGINNDGTVTSWNRIAVTFASGVPPTAIHADMWDFHVDPAVGGSFAWVACDGGVFSQTFVKPYTIAGGPWSLSVAGLHTHQIHTLTVLPTTPIGRSRLAYPTSDNEAWCRDSTPIVMPPAPWEAVGAGGDVNFTVGDAANPRFALLARHRALGTLKHFGGTDVQGIVLVNYKNKRISPTNVVTMSTIGPDAPTTFQFIQAPKGQGSATLDAVMMTDLPLTTWDGNNNVPLAPNTPLAQDTNGMPVLLRHHDFAANPDINTSKGAGWSIEIASLPAGTQGFYVTGTPAAPVYFAFGNDGSGLALWKRIGAQWTKLSVGNLISSAAFGPAFVNPYDQNVLLVLTQTGVQISTNGGTTFALEPQLTALVKGHLAHVAFNFENPREMAAVTSDGGVFFSGGNGWRDLSHVIPTPRSPFTAVGIDCESIYIATDCRSIVRINNYENG